MRSSVFKIILCILAFVSPQTVADNRMPRSDNTISSSTKSHKTCPSHTIASHSATKSPTSKKTRPHSSHSAARSPTKQKMPPSHTAVLKSSEKVPKVPTSPTAGPTTGRKPESPPAKTQAVNSTTTQRAPVIPTKTLKPSSPSATTAANSTKAHISLIAPKVTASKTLTIRNGETAAAQVGWMVVGVGIGGSVSVGSNIFHVAGGIKAIIKENSSGQDELSTIDASTTSSTKSSTSSASPTPYNIYPRLGSTPSEQSVFARDLEQIARLGSVRSITGSRNQLLLWVASLTPARASELRRNPTVRGLEVDQPLQIDLETDSVTGTTPSPNCPPEGCSKRKRDGIILMQQNAPDELKIISQARGAYLSRLPGYAYDSMGGRGVTVYVIDTGINQHHPEFRNMQGSIRWLFPPGEPEIENDPSGHGTCAISKVASPTFGVAKSANIVVVKLSPIDNGIEGSRVLAAWGAVARDIASTNMRGRAVVSIQMGLSRDDVTEDFTTAYRTSLRDVIELDAVVVVASGNRNDQSPGFGLDTYPGLFASELPIVVVGAVQTSGIYASYSKGLAAELSVSAVGRVLCASRQGGVSYRQGTSYATPSVAGLAAYLLSLDQYRVRLLVPGSVAKNVRDLIKSLAYVRLPLQPAVVWNGIDSRQIACPVRRDAKSSACPARNATLPNVPPVTSNPLPSSRLPSSILTDSSTTYDGGETCTFKMTISAYDGSKSTIIETTTIN